MPGPRRRGANGRTKDTETGRQGSVKSVVLLSNPQLLDAGVQGLLDRLEEAEVSIVAADESGYWAREVKRRAPDVIVLDSKDFARQQEPLESILKEQQTLKVIAVNLDQTAVDTWRENRVLETRLEGLLGWIGVFMGGGSAEGRNVA